MTKVVDQLVRAVLYEGYALYPYRPSALENQRRFAFGAVYPRAWAERTGDPWTMRAECLFEGAGTVAITIRFLLLQRSGGAKEHAIRLPVRALAESSARERQFVDELVLQLDIAVMSSGPGLWRIAVEIENRSTLDARDHETAMDATLASTHVVFQATGATAVSAIDPPAHAAAAIASCRTLGTYPVVVARDTILASPIVLADFPALAPESPGDFFDGTESDELRVLTMTDAEKQEAAAADPRIAELIARTEQLGITATARLHGATKLRPLVVGTRVRLRPSRRADAFDLVLAGKLATIATIERDLDGRVHLGVTIDDDPGADLGTLGLPSHRFFFAPDELEVIA